MTHVEHSRTSRTLYSTRLSLSPSIFEDESRNNNLAYICITLLKYSGILVSLYLHSTERDFILSFFMLLSRIYTKSCVSSDYLWFYNCDRFNLSLIVITRVLQALNNYSKIGFCLSIRSILKMLDSLSIQKVFLQRYNFGNKTGVLIFIVFIVIVFDRVFSIQLHCIIKNNTKFTNRTVFNYKMLKCLYILTHLTGIINSKVGQI